MDFSQTTIRCSSLGSIMSNPTGKTPMEKYLFALETLSRKEEQYEKMKKKDGVTGLKLVSDIDALNQLLPELEANKDAEFLSKSCQSYLTKTYALEKYNRIKDVQTKEMVKGVEVEDESIMLFSKMEGKIYEKNTLRLNNTVVSGTPDLFDGESIDKATRVIDIKSSYDIETFLKNVNQPINSGYYWQLQGYLWLTGATVGVISYCLVNTPEIIINQQAEFLLRKLDVATTDNPKYQKEYQKLLRNMTFDDIPMEERIIRIEIERNDDDIEKIYKKVLKCREYLAEFQEKHLFFTKNYRKETINSAELED